MQAAIWKAKDSYFGSKADTLFLITPLLLIVLLFATTFTMGVNLRDFTSQQTTSLIIDIFFLGTLHNFLTYLVLVKSPRAKIWISQYNQKNNISFWTRTILLSIGLFMLFGIYYKLFVFDSTYIHRPIQITVDVLAKVISNHHSLWQIMGISLLFANRQKTEVQLPAASEAFAKNCASEKLLFKYFFIASALSTIVLEVAYTFNIKMVLQHKTPIYYAITLVLIGLSLAILRNQQKNPFGWDLGRTLYISRIFIWSFLFLTPYAYFLAAAIHGIEYGFICKKMIQNEKIAQKTNLISFLILILLFAALVRVGRYNGIVLAGFGETVPILILVLQTLAFTAQYIHTHIDHFIFSMKNPETREFSGYLLNKKAA